MKALISKCHLVYLTALILCILDKLIFLKGYDGYGVVLGVLALLSLIAMFSIDLMKTHGLININFKCGNIVDLTKYKESKNKHTSSNVCKQNSGKVIEFSSKDH